MLYLASYDEQIHVAGEVHGEKQRDKAANHGNTLLTRHDQWRVQLIPGHVATSSLATTSIWPGIGLWHTTKQLAVSASQWYYVFQMLQNISENKYDLSMQMSTTKVEFIVDTLKYPDLTRFQLSPSLAPYTQYH